MSIAIATDHRSEITVVRTVEELDRHAAEWSEFLQTRVDGPRYQHDPVFLRSIACRQSDAGSLFVMLIRDESNIIGIAPFVLARRRVPIRLSVLTLARLPLREIRLLGSEFAVARDCDDTLVYERAFGELGKLSRYDLVDLTDIREDGPLWRSVRSPALRRSSLRLLRSTPSQASHQISCGSTFGEYFGQLKARDRKNIRRAQRRLGETIGVPLTLRAVSTSSDVPGFLDQVDRLYPQTWQAKTFGIWRRNNEEEQRRYSQLADAGWLRCYLLECGPHVLAFQIGIQYGGTFSFVETGFDGRWAHLSPGVALESLVIEDLFSHRCPEFAEFGFGDAEYKRVFSNRCHREIEHVYLVNGWSIYPRLVVAMGACTDFAESVVRRVLKWTRLERLARKLLKRRASHRNAGSIGDTEDAETL